MTLKELQAISRELGVSVRYNADYGEYRVTYPQTAYQALGATVQQARERMEAQAYFTTDRDDALDQARAMAKQSPTLH